MRPYPRNSGARRHRPRLSPFVQINESVCSHQTVISGYCRLTLVDSIIDDDRYEPYAPTSKRRAVSPSITALHMHHHSVSPIVIPRSPVLRSRGSFSQSQANSATSSPTISQSTTQYILNSTAIPNPLSYTNGNPNGTYQGHHRSGSSSSAVSSPTVRSTMALASPILRPVPRLAVGMKRGSAGDMDGEKGLDGAGEAVGSLSLGR